MNAFPRAARPVPVLHRPPDAEQAARNQVSDTAATSAAPSEQKFCWSLFTRVGGSPRLRWLLFLLAVGLAYAPALTGRFVWDDQPLIEHNALIRSPDLAGEAFRHGLFADDPFSRHYRPFQTLTLIADYWFWHLAPFGYHLTNILWQTLAAGLLYQLLRRLLASPGLRPGGGASLGDRPGAEATAFSVTLLWAVHPANNAAVAYVAGRADPLSFSLAAAGGLALFRAGRTGRAASAAGWAALGGLALFAALLSREIAACWMVLLIPGFFLVNRAPRRAAVALVGGVMLAAVGGYLYLRTHAGLATYAAPAMSMFDLPGRVLLALRALGTYLQITFWPARLLMDRPLGCEEFLQKPGGSTRWDLWFAGTTLAGIGGLAALLLGATRRGLGWRLRQLGAGWFLVGFLPISNFFPLNATVADHWLYLPLVGLLLVGAGWWQEIPGPRCRTLAVPMVGLATLLLGGRTFFRCFDWHDGVTLYSRTIAAGGDSARMHHNLALARHGVGDERQAEVEVAETRRRFPTFFPARLLADQLTSLREHEEPSVRAGRLQTWEGNLSIDDPAREDSRRRLDAEITKMLARAGKANEALTRLDATPVAPGATAARWSPVLAMKTELLAHLDRVPEAMAITIAFVRAHPWHQEAAFRLAELQVTAGNDAAALGTLAQADHLDVHGEAALQRMAAIYAHLGDLSRALACQQAAVDAVPDRAESHRRLGVVYTLLGQDVDARREFALAEHLGSISSQHHPHPDRHLPTAGEIIPGVIPPAQNSISPSSQLLPLQ